MNIATNLLNYKRRTIFQSKTGSFFVKDGDKTKYGLKAQYKINREGNPKKLTPTTVDNVPLIIRPKFRVKAKTQATKKIKKKVAQNLRRMRMGERNAENVKPRKTVEGREKISFNEAVAKMKEKQKQIIKNRKKTETLNRKASPKRTEQPESPRRERGKLSEQMFMKMEAIRRASKLFERKMRERAEKEQNNRERREREFRVRANAIRRSRAQAEAERVVRESIELEAKRKERERFIAEAREMARVRRKQEDEKRARDRVEAERKAKADAKAKAKANANAKADANADANADAKAKAKAKADAKAKARVKSGGTIMKPEIKKLFNDLEAARTKANARKAYLTGSRKLHPNKPGGNAALFRKLKNIYNIKVPPVVASLEK